MSSQQESLACESVVLWGTQRLFSSCHPHLEGLGSVGGCNRVPIYNHLGRQLSWHVAWVLEGCLSGRDLPFLKKSSCLTSLTFLKLLVRSQSLSDTHACSSMSSVPCAYSCSWITDDIARGYWWHIHGCHWAICDNSIWLHEQLMKSQRSQARAFLKKGEIPWQHPSHSSIHQDLKQHVKRAVFQGGHIWERPC